MSCCQHTKQQRVCRLTQEPCTNAGHEGKQHLQAHSESQRVQVHTGALHQCEPPRQAIAASTPRSATCAGSRKSPAAMYVAKAGNSCKHTASSNVCRLSQEPCINSSHTGKQQQQAHSEQQRVQAHTRALPHCKPQRQATAASTQRAATCAGSHTSPAPMATTASNSCKHTTSSNVCRLTREPCTNASHKGKQQLQARSKQQLVQAHTRALHQCQPQRHAAAASTQQAATCAGSLQSPTPMQATKAGNSCKHTASSDVCRLTEEPCTNSSHKGKQQLQAHSKQPLVQAHTRALHQCKPQRQAAAASTRQAELLQAHTRALHQCKPQRQATAASTQLAATCAGSHKSPAPMRAAKAGNSCKHTASSNVRRLTQEPCTDSSHKGKQQLQTHSEQQRVQAHT